MESVEYSNDASVFIPLLFTLSWSPIGKIDADELIDEETIQSYLNGKVLNSYLEDIYRTEVISDVFTEALYDLTRQN